MLSQGDRSGDASLFDNVREYIRKVYQKPGNVYLALLHRLDRPVGGLIIFAKTGKAAGRMGKLFKEQQVNKSYLAVVDGPPPNTGYQEHYLKKISPKNVVKVSDRPFEDAQQAKQNFEVLKRTRKFSLLRVEPMTGKPHQIRALLSFEGYPIVGDQKYGSKAPVSDYSIALFSSCISFCHPVKRERMVFRQAPPHSYPWNLFPKRTYLKENPGKGS